MTTASATKPLRSRLSGFQMTRTQYLWAFIGLGVIVAVLVMARGDLRKIYQTQPDFVLGATLSISSICFTKAFTRAGVPAALHLILEQRDKDIREALDRVFIDRLHSMGVHENIALLSRDIAVTNKRINEYYDLQAMEPRFYLTAPLLRVALSDLDDALSIVNRLASTVGSTETTQVYSLPDTIKSQLSDALRDVREASARRNETYEALRVQFESQPVDELWGMFTVLTSDTLKAQRDLEALVSKTILSVPKDRIAVLIGYIEASLRRVRAVGEMIQHKGLEKPPTLDIIIEDLERASVKLAHAQEMSVVPGTEPPEHAS